jgi:hypothetical protein
MHEEHASLGETLRGLDEVIHSPLKGRPAPVADRLIALRTRLAEHFAFEEQGGYMAAVLDHAPQLHRTVGELLAEHRQLAEGLDSLIEAAHAAAAGGHLEEFTGRVKEWAARLRRHEARENRLVQDASNRDTAAED